MSIPPQGSAQSFGDSWNERMRLIRLRRKKEAFRFSEEFRIVPRWLKVLCLVLYVIAVVLAILITTYLPDARLEDLKSDAALATLAAVGIGFIIYFLIREPLPYPCPRCSQPVGPRFNFCPNCKCDLHPSCPNCKHEIAETDKYCPYCAYELGRPAPAATLPPAEARPE